MMDSCGRIHSPRRISQRPRGILKKSLESSPPKDAPVATTYPPFTHLELGRERFEKDITLLNTLRNASCSSARPGGSRRQSSRSSSGLSCEDSNTDMKQHDENRSPAEQNESSTMKVNGPQTKCKKYCNPPEVEEFLTVHAEDIMVDEVDMIRAGRSSGRRSKDTRGGDSAVEVWRN